MNCQAKGSILYLPLLTDGHVQTSYFNMGFLLLQWVCAKNLPGNRKYSISAVNGNAKLMALDSADCFNYRCIDPADALES